MNRRALLATIPAALAATAAQASGGGKKAEEAKPAGQYVELLPVALPIVVYDRVVNYVFVYVRIDLAKSADATKLRAKEPYFRDALVRAGHRTPFTATTDYLHLDEAKLKAAMMREATAIAGPGAVKAITVVSQTPKNRAGVPRPKGAST